jgi:membrane protease subunit HflK
MSTVALEFETREAQPLPPARRRTARRIAVAAAAIWVLSGLYLVAPDREAVVTRFGKVVAPRVLPGLHYALPWPIKTVTKLKVRQLQRLAVGGELPDALLGRSQPLASQFLTGDQNIINLRVVVQYSVGVPADYLFQLQDPARVVGAAVEAELARRVGRRGVDAVLTTEKAAIQDEVRTAVQKLLNSYRVGVLLSTVNIESACATARGRRGIPRCGRRACRCCPHRQRRSGLCQ